MSKTAAFCIGTHAAANQNSISRCRADFERGEFQTIYHAQGINGPTYLAGPAGDVIYTIGSTSGGGAVYALAQENADGQGEMSLSMINSFPGGGSGPRHLTFSRDKTNADGYVDMLYILTEMANTIFVYQFEKESGQYR